MLDWQQRAETWIRHVRGVVGFLKRHPREELAIALAALLFRIGSAISGWLPWNTWPQGGNGLLVARSVCYAGSVVLLVYGGYRIWRLVIPPALPPVEDRPAAIIGPMAFTPEHGPLYRKLGREDELRKLLGWVQDDQIPLVVVMGASGAGKTSLLRAGLSHILADKDIDYHYWEAIPTDPGERLLRSIRESWDGPPRPGSPPEQAAGSSGGPRAGLPATLEDLVNPSAVLCPRRHVIVLDQFEQMRGRSPARDPVFRLLRKVARSAQPPHRVTWVVAFRREFRADWSDFLIPEQERGFYPPELSVRLFSQDQAREVVYRLVEEAGLSVEQKVVDNLVEAATAEGDVSPVDLGIGLLILAELHGRQAGRTVTIRDYHFAGGAEGLLTEYVGKWLDRFPEADQDGLLKALLALHDPLTKQRIAAGRPCSELAQAAGFPESRLRPQLDRLARRDVRLLEVVESEAEAEPRYRLPHERLIPALRRLTGQLLAEVDQARLKFEEAFLAWRNGSQRSQYLLRGRDLRRVGRHEDQIPWGQEADLKRSFLRQSRRRRNWSRSMMAAAVIGLAAAGWFGKEQFDRAEAQAYLNDHGYPPELYDWEHQLQTLKLLNDLNFSRFGWLHSDVIEELHLKAVSSSDSISGLAILVRCSKLRRMTLDLSGSQVKDLSPLEKLSGLTQLSLVLSYSQVKDLSPLEKLSGLTQLSLVLSGSQVTELPALEKLSGLTQLSLNLRSSPVKDLSPLEKLSGLTQLSLNLRFSPVKDLSPLEKLSGRTQLSLDLSGSQVKELPALEKLSGLTQLSLDLSSSPVKDLSPLEKLSGLTQLSLDLNSSPVKDLSPLEKLSGLTQLSLVLSASPVTELPALEKLSGLTQLSLDLRVSTVKDLSPLEKLSGLTQLSLVLSPSPVKELSPLEKLSGLTQLSLDLSFSQVKDLPALEKLSGLTQLSLVLSFSQVKDLSPLEKLSGLTQLSLVLRGSLVTELSPLERVSGLTQLSLDLSSSQVTELSPLERVSGLTQLSLVLSFSPVTELPAPEKLSGLTQLSLDLRGSTVKDLSPLTKLSNLQKLVLIGADRSQRQSLHTIPRTTLRHLVF